MDLKSQRIQSGFTFRLQHWASAPWGSSPSQVRWTGQGWPQRGRTQEPGRISVNLLFHILSRFWGFLPLWLIITTTLSSILKRLTNLIMVLLMDARCCTLPTLLVGLDSGEDNARLGHARFQRDLYSNKCTASQLSIQKLSQIHLCMNVKPL